MRRIVSVWLTDWPVTVWMRSAGRASPPDPDRARPPGEALALIARTQRGAVIHALNPAARAQGLSRGQTQADALAMRPDLICKPAAPEADARALHALAAWCERFSPSVTIDASPDGLEGLFLDATGLAHLFGGEDGLLEQIRARLAEAGAPCRAAIAPTPGGAWALARYGDPGRRATSVGPAELRQALYPLPVEALRLDPRTARQARRLGLKRIGDLFPLPRAGLARRFRGGGGLGLVERLDQALGASGEALDPVRPAARHRAFVAFAEPILDVAGIEARLPDLLAELMRGLETAGVGARGLALTAFRTDGAVQRLEVRSGRPGRDMVLWTRLFREKGLERIDLGFGADALMLVADPVEPLTPSQTEIDDGGAARQAEALSGLVDRLSARLGEDRLLRAEAVDSWTPERAQRLRPALEPRSRGTVSTGAATEGRRPILMLHPPEPVEAMAELPEGAPAQFVWRRAARRVVRADGPERLSPEWWRPRPDGRETRTRDYYRIEDDQGVRYWVFREGLYGWDYTGDPDQRAPSWWMHGLFP